MRPGSARRLVIACAALGLVAVASCRTPTQVTLVMSTDVACAQTKGLAITGAAVGRSERAAPNTISYRCEGAGDLGTLVVTPAAEKDGDVSFRLVIGIDGPAEQCLPPDYKGCVVQRRILSYLPHTELELPVRMLLVCKDVPCDETSTCAASGKCVSARISDPEDCVPPKRCFPLGDPSAEPGGENDAGRDASADGAANDGATSDGSSSDASGDASDDGGGGGGGGDAGAGFGSAFPFPCPQSPGGFCAAGGTCCWSVFSQAGSCEPCGGPNKPLLCTRKSSCGGGSYCCSPATASVSWCRSDCAAAGEEFICMDNSDCPPSKPTCDKGSFPLSPPASYFGKCI